MNILYRISVKDADDKNERILLDKVYHTKKEAVQACESMRKWVVGCCPLVEEYRYRMEG